MDLLPTGWTCILSALAAFLLEVIQNTAVNVLTRTRSFNFHKCHLCFIPVFSIHIYNMCDLFLRKVVCFSLTYVVTMFFQICYAGTV